MPRNWERDFNERPGRTAFKFGSVLVLAAIGISLVGSGVWFLTLPMRTATGVIERTANPDNVIANYEWFKRQVQDVKAIDKRIVATNTAMDAFMQSAGARETWKFEDRQEYNRLNALSIGLQGQRADMVAEYNARTQMANRDIFRTGELPEQLN